MLIELKDLSLNDGQAVFDMIKEIGPGENGFVNRGYEMSYDQFPDYLLTHLNESKGANLKPGNVPQTYYWLFINNRPVGIGKLRHYLNDNLRNNGGHIGYSIRPSERGKGFGNTILNELLKKAKEKGIEEVLITPYETNDRSRKLIEANGCQLKEIKNGYCYYWYKNI